MRSTCHWQRSVHPQRIETQARLAILFYTGCNHGNISRAVFSSSAFAPKSIIAGHPLMELHLRAAVLYAVVFTRSIQGDHVMQRRRAVRNALFLLAACATAQAAGLKESSARTSPGTRHDLSTRSLKVHHAGLSGGIASVYSGGGTASGERMNPGALTAAHPSLPFGTKVRVTNRHTGRSVVVRINDRGPFVKGRVIDLSPAAAKAIGVGGIAQVSLSTN